MAGRGLFTRDFIAKNQWICEYGGELQHTSSFPDGFPQSRHRRRALRTGGEWLSMDSFLECTFFVCTWTARTQPPCAVVDQLMHSALQKLALAFDR